MDKKGLSKVAEVVISAFSQKESPTHEKKITVNPMISTVASWYEKIRTAMDFSEEEVILRASIERILKRRIILGGKAQTVAEPLVRELIWARYFGDETVSESIIEKISQQIGLFLQLKEEIIKKRIVDENTANEWFYHLLSADLERILNPKKQKEIMSNFIFHIMKDNIQITDDSEQNRDVQTFIAVRRAYAKDDIAFLRYHLFTQFFGQMSKSTFNDISKRFKEGYDEISSQLNYPRKERIYNYVKSRTAVFFVLEDLLRLYGRGVGQIYQNEIDLQTAVFEICEVRYKGIASKVQRAIIRGVIFILFTKAFLAFGVEGTYDSLVYGHIQWFALFLNILIPPLLMILVGLFIRTPGQYNSKRILTYIKLVLTEDHPRMGTPLVIKKNPDRKPNTMFIVLWILAFLISFGAIIFVLNQIGMNIVSQGIFIFFLAIVSFLSYRIWLMTRIYMVEEKQGWVTPIADFFVMPVVRVGHHLTEGISQVNILLFILDFAIETPFKGLFAFFEQWFVFLHTKREELE